MLICSTLKILYGQSLITNYFVSEITPRFWKINIYNSFLYNGKNAAQIMAAICHTTNYSPDLLPGINEKFLNKIYEEMSVYSRIKSARK